MFQKLAFSNYYGHIGHYRCYGTNNYGHKFDLHMGVLVKYGQNVNHQ